MSLNPKAFTFRPPKSNRFLIGAVQRCLPILRLFNREICDVEIPADDLRRLKEVKGQRALLAPNHPEGVEPYILFRLSALLGTNFNFMAAKEVFQIPQGFLLKPLVWFGLYPRLVQSLGVYSVVRGTSDTDAFRMTRKLLAEGKRWLVIFPEGEVCWENDTVMPFQQGVAQFGFWACDDLAKQEGTEELPPLNFVPVAIKFIFTEDMRPAIKVSLKRLEKKLGLDPGAEPEKLYRRLRRVGEAVVAANERKHKLKPDPKATLNERIEQTKEQIVARIAGALEVEFRPGLTLLERMRELFNALDQIVYRYPEAAEYAQELEQRPPQEIQKLYDELWRTQHFVALHDGYVGETLTAERFFDVLGRLEWEVFRRRIIKGRRQVHVRIGEPINIAEYYKRYRADKRATREEVTALLESRVKGMLSELSKMSTRVEGEST